ncbi:MAG: biopolymer transporter ExbD [Gammaproteobacteria bacterium]|nr:biopolymer transporter ExbD [Gammaproteobacteria bacterium]
MNLRKQRREGPDVNLTPLIDVVFLLLIFFMVSTTFDRSRELGIELPHSKQGAETEQTERVLELAVDAGGNYYIDGQHLVNPQRGELLEALRKAIEANPDAPVHVSADARASYQSFIMIMDVASELGIARLRLPTISEAPTAGGADTNGDSPAEATR